MKTSKGVSNLLQKLVEYFITFCIIITLNFMLPRLMPGDPLTSLSSAADEITMAYSEEQLTRYKEYYGLDKPLSSQYIAYIANMLQGNIGYSIYYNEDVLVILERRALWTISLVVVSLALSCIIGIILGSLSAWHRNNYIDKILYLMLNCFAEIPAFLIGLFLLFVGAAWLGWFPLSGGRSPFVEFTSPWLQALDFVHHAVLPVITLTLARVGNFYMISR
ncbi:MAG: ABC transporter permease, partial [Sporomusa sp.]